MIAAVSISPDSQPDLLTVGKIAELLSVPIHQVKYAIERYHIQPAQRAGIIRMFRRVDLDSIRWALNRIQSSRRGVL